jgi:hypothetical protein
MELKQKRIWDKRHFKLLDDGVWFRYKSPTEDAELKVKYEDLGLDIVYVRKKSASLVFTVLTFVLVIVGKLLLDDADLEKTVDLIFVITFSLVLFLVLFLSWSDARKPLVGINGGEKSLALLRNSPDEETVDRFIYELHERIKDKMIKLRVRPNDTEFGFDYKKRMLEMLLEENIIDEKKFQKVLQEIRTNNSNIGFNRVIDDTE